MQLERVRKNHMDVEWHEYTDENGKNTPVINASITEKASIIGRVGIMFLSCGTGAWRVRSSMNALAEAMGITCTTDIGLMSIEYTVVMSYQYRGEYVKAEPTGAFYPRF